MSRKQLLYMQRISDCIGELNREGYEYKFYIQQKGEEDSGRRYQILNSNGTMMWSCDSLEQMNYFLDGTIFGISKAKYKLRNK